MSCEARGKNVYYLKRCRAKRAKKKMSTDALIPKVRQSAPTGGGSTNGGGRHQRGIRHQYFDSDRAAHSSVRCHARTIVFAWVYQRFATFHEVRRNAPTGGGLHQRGGGGGTNGGPAYIPVFGRAVVAYCKAAAAVGPRPIRKAPLRGGLEMVAALLVGPPIFFCKRRFRFTAFVLGRRGLLLFCSFVLL